MVYQIQALSQFFLGAVGVAVFYAILRSILTVEELIILLNGLFAGSLTAVAVAYGPLIWNAILGRSPYDNVWQMTIGFAILWAAVCVGVANSVLLRAAGMDIPTSDLTPIARYLAIIAACFQVTAPDFGLGIFHGRDRKVLWTGVTLGLLVAIVLIVFQQAGVS